MSLLKAKILFYRSMAAMTDAGVPILKALRRNQPAAIKKHAAEIADGIEAGRGSMGDLMPEHPQIFSLTECGLVKAGEQTGTLDRIFRSLAARFEFHMQTKMAIISAMGYPVFLYHFAGIAIPLINFIIHGGGPIRLLISILCFLAPPYILCLVWFVIPPGITGLFMHLPVIGKTVKKLNSAAFFKTYSIALNTGLGAVPAVRLAADSCGNIYIRKAFIKCAEFMKERSCPFSEAFEHFFRNLESDTLVFSTIESGEMAGKADEAASQLARLLSTEAETSIGRLTKIIPLLIYLAIVFFIGWSIISFYSTIFSRMSSLI